MLTLFIIVWINGAQERRNVAVFETRPLCEAAGPGVAAFASDWTNGPVYWGCENIGEAA